MMTTRGASAVSAVGEEAAALQRDFQRFEIPGDTYSWFGETTDSPGFARVALRDDHAAAAVPAEWQIAA